MIEEIAKLRYEGLSDYIGEYECEEKEESTRMSSQ